MKRVDRVRWVLALSAAGVGAFWYGRSVAQSTPVTTPVLYSGYLEDSGAPVEGTRDIGLNLWSSTDTSAVGNRACAQAPAPTTVSAGWFTLQLGPECLDAVHRHPALFLEFVVGSTAFPLRPIGAVPYAIRSFEYESGSRLKKVVRKASDGSMDPVPDRWWDTLRNEACSFQVASTPGRDKLCLPDTGVRSASAPCVTPGDTYVDDQCSLPALGGAFSDSPPSYVPWLGASSGLALPGTAQQVYCTQYGSFPCRLGSGTGAFYPAATPLPASDFVSWEETHD